MKTRVAFGVTGAVVVILALFVFPPIVAQLLMMALSVCAAQEFTAATAGKNNKELQIAAMLLALGMSFASARDSYPVYWMRAMLYIGVVVLFVLLLRHHTKFGFQELAQVAQGRPAYRVHSGHSAHGKGNGDGQGHWAGSRRG